MSRSAGHRFLLLAAYAIMAFPDGIGVMAARFGMEGSASLLVFLWFLILPIASGKLCGRVGARRAVGVSLAAALPAFLLLQYARPQSASAAAGLALAGAANVLLQTTVPVWAAEMFGVARISGVLTAGLFVKTAVAIALPFAVAALAAHGDWKLVFPAFAAVTAAVSVAVWRGAPSGEASPSSRGTVSADALVSLLRDRMAALAALVFAVAVVADIAFNLSVPSSVQGRFGGGDAETGVVYAVLFGVKLLAMLLGALLFARSGIWPFLLPSALFAVSGALILFLAGTFHLYLWGVALFAAGYANMYGFVFGVAAPRHPESVPSVSTLLTMAISGGALASPLVWAVSPCGSRSAEALVFALTAVLAALFTRLRRK